MESDLHISNFAIKIFLCDLHNMHKLYSMFGTGKS